MICISVVDVGEIFRSIADYFEHKKNKFCDRLKSNQLNLLDHCIASNNVIQPEDSACNSADSKPSFSKAIETRVVNETAPSDNRVDECENVSISKNISVNADCQVQSVDCEKKKQCIEVQYSISSLSSSAVNCKQQHGESARSANFNKVVRLMSQPRAICSGNGSRSRLFQCPKCAYVAKFKDDYDRHLRKTHNLSVYVCCRCRTAFSDKYKLKRHLLKPCRREPSQVKGPSFAEFLRKSKYHVDDSHPFGCQLCSDSFDSYDEILKHLSKHINIYPGICRFCGMWFMNRYKLRRHIVSSVHDDIADDLFQSFRKEVDKMKIYVPSESAFGKIGKTTFKCASSRPKIHVRKIILGPQRVSLPKQPKKATENKITCKYCQVVFDVRSNYVLHLRNCRKLAKIQMSCIKLQCACCCKKFHHRSHVTRHQKILHTAKQQVPLSETSNQICKSSTQDKNPRISNLIPCFVCWQKFKTQDRFSEHIECHRIWVPNPVGGPVPSTLFDIVPPVPPIQKADNESVNSLNQCSATKNSQVIVPNSNQTENSENQPSSRTSDVISIKLEEPQKKVADETPDLKSLPCPYCDSTFFSIDMLYWHKIDDHKLLAIFRCSDPTCSLEFETAEQYKYHSEIHSQMSFICQVCNEHFFWNAAANPASTFCSPEMHVWSSW